MKKTLLVACTSLFAALLANAEGYQVNTLSARQNGMGHTGTALHLGAESMIFNPAGLTSLDSSLEITGSFTAVLATAKATLPDGTSYTTDNSASTPLSATVGFSIFDNLKAGIAFYTPYGSGINWTDNWPGAELNQSVSLKAFTLQPSIAWEPIKGLSIGAGMMITWGNVNLNKGLINPDSFNTLQGLLIMTGQMPASQYMEYGPTTIPASINLNGSASIALGVNLGVMYDITDQWTVGFNYRSKMMMKVKSGEATLRYANTHSQAILDNVIGLLNQSPFEAQMPCAAIYNFGVSYKPTKKLTLAFDAQLTGWNAYKTLDINFLDNALTGYNQSITKDYHNSWTFHAGAEYNVTNRLDLRLGMMVDTTPVNSMHYNPETPGMCKIEPSVGLSFRPLKNFSIDASFLYVAGLGADNKSCQYKDVLKSKLQNADDIKTFTASYHVHAFNPSIGFTLQF